MLVLLAEHAALLVVGGHLDVVSALGAAAGAEPGEEDVDAVSGLRGEREVEEGVEEGGGVDGPLHDGLVALAVEAGDEGVELEEVVVDEDVVDVPELERRAGGLVEEDHEEGDEGEPELGGAELARAAGADLHQEGPPRDEQEDEGQYERQEVGRDVKVPAALGVKAAGVHANLQKTGINYSYFDPSFNIDLKGVMSNSLKSRG